jgi:oxaloacetate decarboxylase (Na+ extruding) subunit alpha
MGDVQLVDVSLRDGNQSLWGATGLLTPERARTLIPAVRARLADKPLELHAHCTIGLSPLVYLAAPDLGVSVLQVACGALADGSSLPDARRVVANLRALGHTVDVDDRLLAQVARYYGRLASAESLPPGRPQPYDAAFTRHQLAGGVLTTLRRQLSELGLEDRFGRPAAAWRPAGRRLRRRQRTPRTR